MSKPDGGSAFPKQSGIESALGDDRGMSLRDWFAGQALAGWLASKPEEALVNTVMTAEVCYEYAAAMLVERLIVPKEKE